MRSFCVGAVFSHALAGREAFAKTWEVGICPLRLLGTDAMTRALLGLVSGNKKLAQKEGSRCFLMYDRVERLRTWHQDTCRKSQAASAKSSEMEHPGRLGLMTR